MGRLENILFGAGIAISSLLFNPHYVFAQEKTEQKTEAKSDLPKGLTIENLDECISALTKDLDQKLKNLNGQYRVGFINFVNMNSKSRDFLSELIQAEIESKMGAALLHYDKGPLLEEIKRQSSVIFDEDTTVRVGKMHGAQIGLIGKISQVNNTNTEISYKIFISGVNIETAEKVLDCDASLKLDKPLEDMLTQPLIKIEKQEVIVKEIPEVLAQYAKVPKSRLSQKAKELVAEGKGLYDRNEFGKASELFKKAMDMSEEFALDFDSHKYLSLSLVSQGDPEYAKKVYNRLGSDYNKDKNFEKFSAVLAAQAYKLYAESKHEDKTKDFDNEKFLDACKSLEASMLLDSKNVFSLTLSRRIASKQKERELYTKQKTDAVEQTALDEKVNALLQSCKQYENVGNYGGAIKEAMSGRLPGDVILGDNVKNDNRVKDYIKQMEETKKAQTKAIFEFRNESGDDLTFDVYNDDDDKGDVLRGRTNSKVEFNITEKTTFVRVKIGKYDQRFGISKGDYFIFKIGADNKVTNYINDNR